MKISKTSRFFISFMICLSLIVSLKQVAAQGDAGVPAEKEANDFALLIEDSIMSGDPDKFNSYIDWDSIINVATKDFETLPFMKDVIGEFRVGMKQGITSPDRGMAVNIIKATSAEGSYKLLRTHNKDGKVYALFRMISDVGGVNYHDMLLEKSESGELSVKNVFVALTGEYFTETLNRSSIPYVHKVRTENLQDLGEDQASVINEVQIYLNFMGSAQEPEKLLAIYERLPQKYKDSKNSLLLRLNASGALKKEDIYFATINQYRKLYPDSPCIDLISIDHFISKGDFDGSLKAIDGVEKQIGKDPYMDHLRSEIYYKKGDFNTALKIAEKSIQDEPDLISSYWTVLGISLQTKNYDLTAKYLTLVEEELGIALLDLNDVPEYKGFVDSPQYSVWMKSRKKQPEEAPAK